MIRQVYADEELSEEIINAACWIDEQRPGYGEKFIEAYEEAITHLSTYPFSQRARFKSFREIKLGRFSYVLVYKIYGDHIVVYRLVHISRELRKRYGK